MKVTVQNGARHGLTRHDVESIIPLFPPAWSNCVEKIVLYQSSTDSLFATYYPNSRSLGLHWPRATQIVSKEEGVRELLIAISVAAERGELPSMLAKSMRLRHVEALEDLHARCILALAPQ